MDVGLPIVPCALGSQDDDLGRRGKGGLAGKERVVFGLPGFQPFDERFQDVHVVAIVHGNRNLGFDLLEDFPRRLGRHGESPADGDEGDIDLPDLFELFGSQGMAQIAEMRDAERAQIKDECGPFESGTESLLIDRQVVNENVSHVHTDPIPLGAIVRQSAQDDRVAAG